MDVTPSLITPPPFPCMTTQILTASGLHRLQVLERAPLGLYAAALAASVLMWPGSSWKHVGPRVGVGTAASMGAILAKPSPLPLAILTLTPTLSLLRLLTLTSTSPWP